jgi:hypothetical protein
LAALFIPVAVALLPFAKLPKPVPVAKVPFATLLWPDAVALSPFAVLLWPVAVANKPFAVLNDPVAVAALPVALAVLPKAVAAVPAAVAFAPTAVDCAPVEAAAAQVPVRPVLVEAHCAKAGEAPNTRRHPGRQRQGAQGAAGDGAPSHEAGAQAERKFERLIRDSNIAVARTVLVRVDCPGSHVEPPPVSGTAATPARATNANLDCFVCKFAFESSGTYTSFGCGPMTQRPILNALIG